MASEIHKTRLKNVLSDNPLDEGIIRIYKTEEGFRFGLNDMTHRAEVDTDRASLIRIRDLIDKVLGA